MHEGMLQTADGRRLRLVAASRDALVNTAAQIDGYIDQLSPLGPGEALGPDPMPKVIEHAVRQLESQLGGHDAFDVMSMLSQYLVPPDLTGWSEAGSSSRDAWSAAEVVALVLLGHGLPTRADDQSGRTASIIPELVTSAAAVVQLASVNGIVRHSQTVGTGFAADGMTAMALRLSTHETSVRGRQFPAVAIRINDAVLRTPRTDTAFQTVLGFTYDQVITTRDALVEVVAGSHEGAYDRLAEAAQSGAPPDTDTLAAFRAIFEAPSGLRQVTAAQVSEVAGLDLDVVERILDRFAIRPDDRTPLQLVRDFVEGRNPMAGVAMLHAPDRAYLPLPGAIALDEIRRTCEAPIKHSPGWTAYGRSRDRAVETLVTDTLTSMLLDRAAVHRNLRYRDPQAGHDLSRVSTTHQDAPPTEADCLLVLDGVALCVEVKAGDLRPRSRQGGVAQLHGDLDKTVSDAARQADRLRTLIRDHQGVWLESGTWLDLGYVQEIQSLVVCLDDLGPLALCTAEMVRAGLLPQTNLPWVVSLHDLLVVEHVLDRPEHFLTYLRRRTNRDAALWVTGSDELDLLMWFVSGGFYFVPDPDRIQGRHPRGKSPTQRMRNEYTDQGRTLVGTFTDTLDAHYYWLDGTSSQPADCPRRGNPPRALELVIAAMRERDLAGWWRVAADIDGYSTHAQDQMAHNIERSLDRSRRDGGFHTFTTGGEDDTGSWVYIFATGPDSPANRTLLHDYLAAKKHQEHADRAVGVHLKLDGTPLYTVWLAHPPQHDPDLDALARAMRLIPPTGHPPR